MRSCTLNPDKFLMPVDVRQKAFSQLSFSIFEWKRKTKQKWMTSGSWEIINKTSKKLGIQWAIAGVKSRIINASMKQNVSMCVNNIKGKVDSLKGNVFICGQWISYDKHTESRRDLPIIYRLLDLPSVSLQRAFFANWVKIDQIFGMKSRHDCLKDTRAIRLKDQI